MSLNAMQGSGPIGADPRHSPGADENSILAKQIATRNLQYIERALGPAIRREPEVRRVTHDAQLKATTVHGGTDHKPQSQEVNPPRNDLQSKGGKEAENEREQLNVGQVKPNECPCPCSNKAFDWPLGGKYSCCCTGCGIHQRCYNVISNADWAYGIRLCATCRQHAVDEASSEQTPRPLTPPQRVPTVKSRFSTSNLGKETSRILKRNLQGFNEDAGLPVDDTAALVVIEEFPNRYPAPERRDR